ncbi:hypothetical protein C0995_002306 [Termitomyces sp. Mi166|nr:hypothetical protein C0995_002306 [Termitomyces sp. Mi166\
MSHGSYSSHSGSLMTEDEEDWEDYVKGGYHPVQLGDQFSEGRYVVVRKLGWGHFSTVWLAKDTKCDRHVALKVVKSAPRYTETALDEIKLLQRLITSSSPPPNHPGRSHVISFLDHFRHKGPNGTHVCMVFEVLGENLLGLIKRHQNKGVPIHLVRQIAKQVLLGLDYMHRCCGVIHTDLKPENVLISIDDVESIIQAELTTSSSPTPKLTGVPPSKGRGGNQTPRSESVFITGSQPLPSPSSMSSLSAFADRAAESASSSYSSPMIDRWAFAMSKIDQRRPSQDLAGGVRNVSLASDDTPNNKSLLPAPGPSLLTQQAPPRRGSIPVPVQNDKDPIDLGHAKMMSVDMDAALTEFLEAGMRGDGDGDGDVGDVEHITVKIADLGNGAWVFHSTTATATFGADPAPNSNMGRTPLYRRYTNEAVSMSRSYTRCQMGSQRGYMERSMCRGDYLFDPASGSRYSKDDDHIAQIMELMGEIPRSIAFSGKYSGEFFNRKGELRHITKLRYWPLSSVLHDKYLFPSTEADALAGFLTPMLRLHPEKRASAREMAGHAWLGGVVVQGEVDVGTGAGAGAGGEEDVPVVVGNGEEEGAGVSADAMKPVDDGEVSASGSTSAGSGTEPARRGQGTVKLGKAPAGSAPRSSGSGSGGSTTFMVPIVDRLDSSAAAAADDDDAPFFFLLFGTKNVF